MLNKSISLHITFSRNYSDQNSLPTTVIELTILASVNKLFLHVNKYLLIRLITTVSVNKHLTINSYDAYISMSYPIIIYIQKSLFINILLFSAFFRLFVSHIITKRNASVNWKSTMIKRSFKSGFRRWLQRYVCRESPSCMVFFGLRQTYLWSFFFFFLMSVHVSGKFMHSPMLNAEKIAPSKMWTINFSELWCLFL